MGPKLKKKYISATDKEEILHPVQEQSRKESMTFLPYSDLRYTPLPVPIPPRRHEIRFEKVMVLKKKRLLSFSSNIEKMKDVQAKPDIPSAIDTTRQISRTKGKSSSNSLNIKAVNSQPMSKWFGPGELPMIPPAIAVLRRTHEETCAYTQMLKCSFRREFGLLRIFEEEKQRELEIENYLMKRTGKTRQNLLIRRHQHLPHIDHVGQEITYMELERTETPEVICNNDIFSEAAREARGESSIRRTLTRREKGYNVITDWIGCPEVTDILAEKLRLKSCIINKINLKNQESQSSSDASDFIPRFEELGLVGLSYEKAQKQMKEVLPIKTVKESYKGGLSAEPSKLKYENKMYNISGFHTHEREISSEEPIAGLFIGEINLFWTRDPERTMKKWVIDLGCVAEIGKDSICSITMKNIGTTAVHFKWEKVPPANVFQLKKYSLRRFGFDCWGSVILPGEVFRLPVLYRCIEPGFYSEDWRLITLPVLENGAEIITRLWGITRQYDPYRRVRQQIDEDLDKNMASAIVDHRVKKIVDYLPLKEVPLTDTRFLLVHLGPDLFHLHNPWLQYHCASVYRLGKLAAMVENKNCLIASSSIQDKIGLSHAYLDESMSELLTSQKLANDGSDEELFQSLRTQMVDFKYENMIKQDMFTDGGSIGSDEGFVSVNQIKRLIEELIVPEVPEITPANQEPPEDEALEYGQAAGKNKRPLAVNLTNPDFSVDQIRQNILTNVVDSEEHKEAHFLIMSEQVTRLLFRTDVSLDNWKIVVGHTLLCDKIDAFSEFAIFLKDKCCQGQLLEEIPKRATPKSEISEQFVEDELGGQEDDPEYSSNMSDSLSDTIPTCAESHPRYALDYLRFQDQYYSRLFCRMYSLLAEYVDDLDNLLSKVEKRQFSTEEVAFTRVRNIPMNFSVEDALNAPLPPKWVKLAQRIESTLQKNRARFDSVNDGQWPV